MARPRKEGIAYFPCDTEFDSKVGLLETQYGNNGHSTLIRLWQMAYREGGFIDMKQPGIWEILKKENLISVKLIQKILEECVRLGLFDAEKLSTEGILTSSGILKRMADITKGRDRKRTEREVRRGQTADKPPVSHGQTTDSSALKEKEKEKEYREAPPTPSKGAASGPPSWGVLSKYIHDRCPKIDDDLLNVEIESIYRKLRQDPKDDWQKYVNGCIRRILGAEVTRKENAVKDVNEGRSEVFTGRYQRGPNADKVRPGQKTNEYGQPLNDDGGLEVVL